MNPQDLVGSEVISVKEYHNSMIIVFDNNHFVEVSTFGGSLEDAIHEISDEE